MANAGTHMEGVHNLFGEWNNIQHAYSLWIAATVINLPRLHMRGFGSFQI
jgi:hypothetical protein